MDPKTSTAAFRASLHGLPYAETVASKPPIWVKSSTSLTPAAGSPDQPSPHSLVTIDTKRYNNGDWLRPVVSPSIRDSQTSINSPSSFASSASVPKILVDGEDGKEKERKTTEAFTGLALNIPSTSSFADELDAGNMKFSNRGSMLIDSSKFSRSNTRQSARLDTITDTQEAKPRPSPPPRPTAKSLTTDEEQLSEKVRCFYAIGSDNPYDSDALSSMATKIGLRWQDAIGTKTEASSTASLSRGNSTTDIHEEIEQKQNSERPTSGYQREENELAGGIEDWADVENADVDRYGFIVPKQDTINGLSRSGTSKDPRSLARVSTSLQLASEAPRRKTTVRRAPGSAHGTPHQPRRSPSEKSLRRPQSSPNGGVSQHTTFRSRDRKLMDTAGDMLTLPRTTSMRVEPGQSASEDPRARRKEIEREEKWRKMARPVPSSAQGGGMTFHFDTASPKLIERTWKGIPDKWRGAAWYAFLSASAKKRRDCASDEELLLFFNKYQEQSSPDDVQIDIDVPRTISSHIMFRRRYRGGQRLLFRVLHAMSLHFETGYVQGMAALAATLLAYYEEEKAFIMLVRLWELRGLERLYRSGFGGLMKALNDFETQWLGDGELAKKLADLNIVPTAYGTRWYLTLFNYSIPFPAQLRVWDVFMLLDGDDEGPVKVRGARVAGNEAGVNGNGAAEQGKEDVHFGTTLDVLHATSAALIDGMREILMESDFENNMKVLTSWIPIKDEDMLMRVAKAEWKTHRQKSGRS